VAAATTPGHTAGVAVTALSLSNTSRENNMKAWQIIIMVAGISLLTAGKWVRMQDGEVQEVWKYRPNFHPAVMAQIVEAPDGVENNWRYQGGAWLPPKTQEELAQDAFDKLRATLLTAPAFKARKTMSAQFVYRLTGPLEAGYPDVTTPMTTNGLGVALCLDDFMDYLQGRQDGDATPEELQALRQQAKAARLYLKSLKGD